MSQSKCKTTICATKAGECNPKYPAINIATAEDIRLAPSSFFSLMSGIKVPFSRSCETIAVITNNKPSAVDNASAAPPAAFNANTHAGNCVIFGLANTLNHDRH